MFKASSRVQPEDEMVWSLDFEGRSGVCIVRSLRCPVKTCYRFEVQHTHFSSSTVSSLPHASLYATQMGNKTLQTKRQSRANHATHLNLFPSTNPPPLLILPQQMILPSRRRRILRPLSSRRRRIHSNSILIAGRRIAIFLLSRHTRASGQMRRHGTFRFDGSRRDLVCAKLGILSTLHFELFVYRGGGFGFGVGDAGEELGWWGDAGEDEDVKSKGEDDVLWLREGMLAGSSHMIVYWCSSHHLPYNASKLPRAYLCRAASIAQSDPDV